jgi:hypothetical protein
VGRPRGRLAVKRVIVPFILALIAVLLAALTPAATAPPAEAVEEWKNFDAVADKVWVNKFGGITIEGWADCTQAVEEKYPDAADRPEVVVVNVNWDAIQYVGRTKVIFAQHGSSIATQCYPGEPGTNRWRTWSPAGEAPWWVYSADGKFAPGPIAVEVQGYGGFGEGEDTVNLEMRSQAVLKAVRYR